MKCMLFSSAYTGIASEHPSVFTHARIIQNTGIQGPYEECFITGIQFAHIGMVGHACPHWNDGSLHPTPVGDSWTMNEWIYKFVRRKLKKHGFTYMERNRNQWILLTSLSTQSWHEHKTLWTNNSNIFYNVLAHIGMMRLHYPLPWVNMKEGTDEYIECKHIIE